MSLFSLILGVFQFWDEVSAFIAMLKGTPQEQHAAIMKKVSEAFDEKNPNHPDRPTWDN